MKSPVHHLRRAHATVKHHAARVRRLLHPSTLGGIPELTVLAVLIMLPFAYSPFNTDPHRFGTATLLLAGLTVLCLNLALRYLMVVLKYRLKDSARPFEDPTSVSEAGTSHELHLAGMVAPLAAALIVFLLLLIFSGNLALGLNSTLGMVGLALLFIYAVKSTFHEVASCKSCKRVERAWIFSLVVTAAFWLIFQSPLFTKIDTGLGQTKVFNAAWTKAKILTRSQPLTLTTPDYLTSLRVAVGILINSPLKGSGIGHYGNAFSMYRGAEFNRSPNWNLPFTHSASTLTDWVTEGGLLGLVIYLLLFLPGLLLIFSVLKISKIDNLKAIIAKIINPKSYFLDPAFYLWALAVASLFYSFPLADYVLYLIGLVIIPFPSLRGVRQEADDEAISARLPRSLRSLAMTNGIKVLTFLAIPALAIYLFVPIIRADHYFDRSRQVLNATNGGRTAYLLLQKAIAANPGNDTYHRAYAQLNLSLAGSVGNTDQATAGKLAQQAAREVKLAVSLNPGDWANPATAGTLYETLASAGLPAQAGGPDAQTAAGLAESNLLAAVKYNPFDPATRLNLGGYYFFFKKDLARAKAEVDKAVSLKDDYADAHYALSAIYRQTGETAKAVTELKKVLALFPAGSPNYRQVQSELQALEASRK